MNIGFIGLGHMGLPMAINLLQGGHNVTGFDLLPTSLAAFKNEGGKIITDIKEITRNQDVIITMLQTGKQVQNVCLTDSGIFNTSSGLKLYIDCSSIDIETSKLIHQKGNDLNIPVLDAPVSGGVAGAKAKTLTFMVGGSEKAFEQAKPLFEIMGKNIIHTGAGGSGQAAKICNNLLLGVSMVSVAEAFLLGEKLGLDPKKLYEVVINSSGQSWVMSKYVPVADIIEHAPANKNFTPGFTAAMMLKDLYLSQQAAESVHMKTLLGEVATKLYQQFNDNQQGGLDFSGIIKLLEKVDKNNT